MTARLRPLDADAAGPPAPPPFRLGYCRWLDGLRGLAVLAVVGAHLDLFRGGYLGVDVFFVLSGFLITALLAGEWQRAGRISLGRFYARRCLRLQPALVALLAIGLAYTAYYLPEQAAAFRAEAFVTACYATNWPNVHLTAMPTLSHTWSLCVEEQFYLLWPVLLYGMLRAGLSVRQILLVSLGGAAVSALFRLLIISSYPTSHPAYVPNVHWLYISSHTRADSLLIGAAVGLLAASGSIPRGWWFRWLTGIGSLAAAGGIGYLVWSLSLFTRGLYRGGLTGVALLVAVVLLHFLASPSHLAGRVLGSTPLVFFGRLSYSIYLVHLPVLHWTPHGPLGWYQMKNVGLMFGMILCFAGLSYLLVEKPFLRLKSRFEGDAGAGVAATPRLAAAA